MTLRWRNDGGYATVTSAGIIIALLGLCAAIGLAATGLIATRQAALAADLAAVAGAWAHHHGEDACAAAAQVAGLNRASMNTCQVAGADVTVTVGVRGREAGAKAGPI